MNAEQKKRDVAITALIEAGVITEDDAYPSNDINECYAAQDALIAAHADQRNGVTNMNQNLIVLNHYVELDQWKSVTIGGVPTRQAIVMGHNGPVLAIRDPQYGFIADIELTVDEE